MKRYQILLSGISHSNEHGVKFKVFWARRRVVEQIGTRKVQKLVRKLDLKRGHYWITELARLSAPRTEVLQGIVGPPTD